MSIDTTVYHVKMRSFRECDTKANNKEGRGGRRKGKNISKEFGEQAVYWLIPHLLAILSHYFPKSAFRYTVIYFYIYLEEGSKLWIVVINTRTINAHTKFDLNTSSRIWEYWNKNKKKKKEEQISCWPSDFIKTGAYVRFWGRANKSVILNLFLKSKNNKWITNTLVKYLLNISL